MAAYGSYGLEESAQDGELEERVERHVVCARASRQASVRAGVRLVWARGLVPQGWECGERAGVSVSLRGGVARL